MSAATKLLAQAAVRDYRENPHLMREAIQNGQMRNLIRADVEAAMRDIPTPSIFPHLKAAASQLLAHGGMEGMGEDEAVGTNDTWADPSAGDQGSLFTPSDTSASGVPGMVTSYSQLTPSATPKPKPATTAPAASGGDNWTGMLSSVIKSAADAGSAIFKAQTQAQTASKTASLMSKLFGAPATGTAQASMLGGGMGTLLMIGGVGAVAVIAISKLSSGGGKKSSRRRSRR